ncbi:MAG: methyltransferase domain-containing protein [Motiliproteus sp.]
MDANPAEHVDHVGNAVDLSRFDDGTFSEIYSSHVVEHFDYHNELIKTLKEWRRVLVPGGLMYVSVPDLDVLSGLMIDKSKMTPDERFQVMRMIFGGHVDQYDYHLVGLNEEFLSGFLQASGFVNIMKVQNFCQFKFHDTSNAVYKGNVISLNMIAYKPK